MIDLFDTHSLLEFRLELSQTCTGTCCHNMYLSKINDKNILQYPINTIFS